MLLKEGADVNAQGGPFGSVLQAALLINGREKVVAMLLEKGADINAQGGFHGNALQAPKSKDKSDLNKDSAVYRPLSTCYYISKFVIIITIFAVFFIILKIGV